MYQKIRLLKYTIDQSNNNQTSRIVHQIKQAASVTPASSSVLNGSAWSYCPRCTASTTVCRSHQLIFLQH